MRPDAVRPRCRLKSQDRRDEGTIMRPPKTLAGAAVAGAVVLSTVLAGATASASSRSGAVVHPPSHRERVQASAAAANANVELLQAAASDVVDQALAVHALWHEPYYRAPAKRLYVAVAALERKARREDPSLQPRDTTDVMGAVPENLVRHRSRMPRHAHIYATHTLLRFNGHTVPAQPSMGNGHNRPLAGSWPATYAKSDGVYVRPSIPNVKNATVGLVAVRQALKELGTPYVWAGGGPAVFDCSGLVQWAY